MNNTADPDEGHRHKKEARAKNKVVQDINKAESGAACWTARRIRR